MSTINLKLNKFDMSSIDTSCKIVIIGKPGTGKSTLIEDILYQLHDRLPIGVVMVGTLEGADEYRKIIPDSYIYEDFNQEVVNTLMKRQRKAVKRRWQNPYSFLVVDDCSFDLKWIRHKTTREIFMNGRHFKLLVIIALQYSMGLPPDLRACIDYVFLLRENIPKNRDRLYEHYCGIFPTKAVFENVFSACTENYECMVIKNRCISNQIEDMVFWYKAELHPPFRMGSKRIWEYHDKNYNQHYDSDEDDDVNPVYNYGSQHTKRPARYVIEKYG